MKCFIINYNRLLLPVEMAKYLTSCSIDVFIIDNNSTYEPLLEYYKTCPYEVIRMDKNYGHSVFWKSYDLYNKYCKGEHHIVTDPDLDLSNIPKDFLSVLEEGLKKYPNFPKCGFSLEIDDLPDTEMGREARNWERQYWNHKLDDMYFSEAVDTTFALYSRFGQTYSAMRTNKPYCAKHVPWYYNDFDTLSEDEKYYYKTIETSSHWSKYIKK